METPAGEGKVEERLVVRVLNRKPVAVPPIWLMRQAGRYLPEYRETRQRAGSFLDLCYNPELACEVTLQPIRRFGFDAAILFSDILVVPDALGRKVWFEEGHGPRLEPIKRGEEIAALQVEGVVERLRKVIEAVGLIRQGLPEAVTLLGFCGAPWTVATYMVAGQGTSDQAPARLMAYEAPELFQQLIDKLVEASADYLVAQLRAGAEAVQIFDTWAGVLDRNGLQRWVIEPTRAIVEKVRAEVPGAKIIGFPKGASLYYRAFIAGTGVDAVGVDWTMPRDYVAKRIQPHAVVQGNIDPLLMIAGGSALDDAVDEVMDTLSGGPLIVNLGHGITPQGDVGNVERLIERVRSFKK